MFPLYESTSLLLAIAAVAACTSIYTALRGRPPLWRAALLLVLGALWPWPIALILGLDHYTIGMAFYAGVWTVGALVAGLVWGALARRIPTAVPIAMVALAPSLAGSAYLLERQRVPNATCATEVEVHIGDLGLTVPRGIGLRSVEASGAPEQVWEGSYGDGLKVKSEVRALCKITDGGNTSVKLAHAWFSFSSLRRAIEADCESAASFPSRLAVCHALARTQPTVVQFYARPDGVPAPSLSHFNTEYVTQERARGKLEGYRCKDSTLGPATRYCTVWQQLTPQVLAVSTVKLGPRQEGEDPLADSVILLIEMVRRLSAK